MVLQGLIHSGTVLVLVVSAHPKSNYLLMPPEAKEHHSLFVDCQQIALKVQPNAIVLCLCHITTNVQFERPPTN